MELKRTVCAVVTIFALMMSGVALDLSDSYASVSSIFDSLTDENAGQTAFRSLLIPGGGRSEAMGSAFSALANDISFFETNPAGSATMKNTELAVFHNSWIADSRLETVSFTQRTDTTGYGASIRCFYVPFTEYNSFGERVSRGYYTETLGVLNLSHNFLAGYYFKGIALGVNLKAGYRGMPDYSDNDGTIQSGSGLDQSAFTIMGDFGMQTRFNFFKLYNSRDPNFSVGLTARNIGPPVVPIGGGESEALPSLLTAGAAWKWAKPMTISAEVQQPVNFLDVAESESMAYGAGFSVEFVKFFTFLAGFQLKGANPRVTIGGEMNVNDLQFNVNYTLDMTTQVALFNRISLAAKLNLGDRGRANKEKKVEDLYIRGLRLYAAGELESAVGLWNEALEIDRHFDPAIEGVAAATTTLAIQKKIHDLQQLE